MKQRWGLYRNVLRPTPWDPWGVKQHHWHLPVIKSIREGIICLFSLSKYLFSAAILIKRFQCPLAQRSVSSSLAPGPDIKLFILVGLGRSFFCLLLGPPGFNFCFSSAPVFQWCCSTPQGSPGVGRNTFLSSPHLCFIIVFICDLFVSRDDPLMS